MPPGVVLNPQYLQAYNTQYRQNPDVQHQVEEEPIYVNAKQYHRILIRREQRAKLERQNKLVKQRKPFLHQSRFLLSFFNFRHNHAKNRKRGPNGRFMSKKEREKYEAEQAAAQQGQQNQDGLTNGSDPMHEDGQNVSMESSKREDVLYDEGSVEATVSQLQNQNHDDK
jgi:nuclear transcription factor Y, alpha